MSKPWLAAAAVLSAACMLFVATRTPQPTALEGWHSQEQVWHPFLIIPSPLTSQALSPNSALAVQGLWRAPVMSQAQRELSRVRAEIRADRSLNARVARPIAPLSSLRFHQLPQTGSELGMKVFAGHMLCGVGETSCEHPCSAFHTITETERCVSSSPAFLDCTTILYL